ncbi:MAG: hypothetical protein K0Q93_942 [Nocardioidaceae bacterium]|nr:hypothetical protein [Nocardioidaceae bacterium]
MWGRLVTRALHTFSPSSAQPGADTERTGGHGHQSDIADFAAARLWRCQCGSADVDSRWHAAVRERLTMAHNPGLRRGRIRYELRLQGHLDQHWSRWFTGLTMTDNQYGTTSLCGTLADQAELHGQRSNRRVRPASSRNRGRRRAHSKPASRTPRRTP